MPEIQVLLTDTGAVLALTDLPSKLGELPSWWPSGQKVAVSGSQPARKELSKQEVSERVLALFVEKDVICGQ